MFAIGRSLSRAREIPIRRYDDGRERGQVEWTRRINKCVQGKNFYSNFSRNFFATFRSRHDAALDAIRLWRHGTTQWCLILIFRCTWNGKISKYSGRPWYLRLFALRCNVGLFDSSGGVRARNLRCWRLLNFSKTLRKLDKIYLKI